MSMYRKIAEIIDAGDPVVLCTIVKAQGSTPRGTGSKMLVYPDGRTDGSVGGGELESRVVAVALETLKDGQPQTIAYTMAEPGRGDPGVCGGSLEVFVEPLLPKATIVVAGGGHVGQAVVELAAWMGYRVVLTDDRPEFCNPVAAPDADLHIVAPLGALTEHLAITPYTYIILTTRNVLVDVEGLPELLASPAAFIGAIGSKRRWATTREHLLAAGVPVEQIDRVVSPLGLELKAETPKEIALSILAELVMLQRGGDGGRMAI